VNSSDEEVEIKTTTNVHEYFLTPDDVGLHIRAIYIPIRDDGVKGVAFSASTSEPILAGKESNLFVRSSTATAPNHKC
jgi:hypothetical protein